MSDSSDGKERTVMGGSRSSVHGAVRFPAQQTPWRETTGTRNSAASVPQGFPSVWACRQRDDGRYGCRRGVRRRGTCQTPRRCGRWRTFCPLGPLLIEAEVDLLGNLDKILVDWHQCFALAFVFRRAFAVLAGRAVGLTFSASNRIAEDGAARHRKSRTCFCPADSRCHQNSSDRGRCP